MFKQAVLSTTIESQPSLPNLCLIVFGCFLKSGTKLKKLQARVLGMLSQCPANLLDPLMSIYQLHTADRNYLLEHVSHLYLQGNYKEVGHVFQINLPCQLSVSFFLDAFQCEFHFSPAAARCECCSLVCSSHVQEQPGLNLGFSVG